MDYKKSFYNNVMWHEGEAYLWNTLSGALLRLDADALLFLEKYDETDQSGNEYYDLFRKNGCIVPGDLNEINQVLLQEKTAILNPNQPVLHFTVAPGLGCNYDCVYCFEKHMESRLSMTEKTQQDTVDYILRLAEGNPSLKYLMIRWFGGEPLLYMDSICRMSGRLMAWCDAHHVQYYAEMITNGRFLTAENAEKLKKVHVQYVQLALDGMPEQYMRLKRASREDFDAVIENIAASAGILPIHVRVNVTDHYEDVLALTHYLLKEKKLEHRIKIGLAHVRNYDSASGEEETARHRDFMAFEEKYISLFGEGGPYAADSLAFHVPRRQPANCYKICSFNYCIGPEGELYRCEHHFGLKDRAVGSIYEGNRYSDQELRLAEYRHPDKCRTCRIFPVCLSGCLVYSGLAMACEEMKKHHFLLLMKNCSRS